jgi:glyoxalase family protein
VPAEHAIRGAYGTTTSVREPEPMDDFLREAFNCKHLGSEGPHHQYEIEGDGYGRVLELVEEPDLPQGTWRFGEGTIHHHAFDVGTAENQLKVKDYIVGLGYTDVSDVKDRGYFFSVYLRTPGGALFELAYSHEAGFTIDESEDELGTHMCIPPHWEDRRSEIDQLEPIETIEEVKA